VYPLRSHLNLFPSRVPRPHPLTLQTAPMQLRLSDKRELHGPYQMPIWELVLLLWSFLHPHRPWHPTGLAQTPVLDERRKRSQRDKRLLIVNVWFAPCSTLVSPPPMTVSSTSWPLWLLQMYRYSYCTLDRQKVYLYPGLTKKAGISEPISNTSQSLPYPFVKNVS